MMMPSSIFREGSNHFLWERQCGPRTDCGT